ncbi:hypothetical protein [Cupriavidus metallidurans]
MARPHSYTDFVMAVLFAVGGALDAAEMHMVRVAFASGQTVRATVNDILRCNAA